MEILGNRYVQVVLGVLLGVFLGYTLLPTKTVTKEVHTDADTKIIAALRTQLQSNTHTHSVTTATGNSVVTVTDSNTISTSSSQGTTNTHNTTSTQSYEKTEYNKKWVRLTALIGTEPMKGIVSGEGLIEVNIIGPLGVAVGYQRYTPTNANIGKVGFSWDF